MSDAHFTPRFTPSPDGLVAEFYRHLAQGSLRLQNEQKIAHAGLIAQHGALVGLGRLRDVVELKLSGVFQMADCGQGIFDIDERCQNRCPIRSQQFAFFRLHFIALCAQSTVIENRLEQIRAQRHRGPRATDGQHSSLQGRILNARATGQRQAGKHRGTRDDHICMAGAQVLFGAHDIGPPREQFGGQTCCDDRFRHRIQRQSLHDKLFRLPSQQ